MTEREFQKFKEEFHTEMVKEAGFHPNHEDEILAEMEIILHRGVLYFPRYECRELEGYSTAPHSIFTIGALKNMDAYDQFPLDGEVLICKCLWDQWLVSYGNWSLEVECPKCGNKFCAYSG